jgi:hypothetical protein
MLLAADTWRGPKYNSPLVQVILLEYARHKRLVATGTFLRAGAKSKTDITKVPLHMAEVAWVLAGVGMPLPLSALR